MKPSARREELASYAHQAWSGWMAYLFDKSKDHEDGSVTIPPDLVERWKRQLATDYENLSEQEKESDRAEADRMLEIFARHNKAKDYERELNDRAQYEIYLLKCVGGQPAMSFEQFRDERLTEGGGS